MGTVWRARQSRPVRREVALKLLRSGPGFAGSGGGFETERQALALMDHDCIAKVYEAGATEDGFPYFAMEYVRGLPITARCDKNRLTVPERLELLARVCAGVEGGRAARAPLRRMEEGGFRGKLARTPHRLGRVAQL